MQKPTVGERELRAISETELRAENQGDQFVLTGYAAKFGVMSKPLPGGWTEVIAPQAFNRSLAAYAPVQFRFNHLPTQILARSENGTLDLSVDHIGLRFRAQLNKKMQSSRDLFEAVKSGLYSECSFGFVVREERWDGNVRKLLDLDLFDCSLVGDAQYPQTSASARAAAATSADDLPTFAELQITAARIQRNLDDENYRRVAQLGVEIRAADDAADENEPDQDSGDENPNKDEFEEFNCAFERYRALSFNDKSVICIDENADENEACIYRFAYTRDSEGNVVVDKSSRKEVTA